MKNRVELFDDGEGLVVVGKKAVVARFLKSVDLRSQAVDFNLSDLSRFLKAGSEASHIAAEAYEQSSKYIKLTPESAERLKKAGALMKTKEKGISHVMLGETGTKSMKWLQAHDPGTSLATNPAILTGIGGVMAQLSTQAEGRELQEMLVRIDEKLDDLLRNERDKYLSQIDGFEQQLARWMIQLENDGIVQVIWDKAAGFERSLLDFENLTLRKLETLADKVEDIKKAGSLKKEMGKVEGEVALYLSALGKCYNLLNEFSRIEERHAFITDPDGFDNHLFGLSEARANRRATIIERTAPLLKRLNSAASVAEDNVLLHAPAARAVISSLNSAAGSIDLLYRTLGIDSEIQKLSLMPWREALRDPHKRAVAAKDAGEKTAMLSAAGAGIALVAVKRLR